MNSAAQEVAVAKTLLGLTDAQARELQTGLETQKAAYNSAKTQYDAAIRMGNTALAESAKAKMDAAHEAAQDLRAKYNYTGDTTALTDGGSYDGGAGGSSGTINNGSFFYVNLVQQYTITASAGTGGSISPSGNVVLVRGSDRKFTFTPNAGYEVKSVTVDGKAVEKADSYTFKNVTVAHSISVEFQKKGCTITASAGTGGTISPSGTTTVEYGGKQKYSVSASTGYKIEDVKIDGKSEGMVSTYTFSNVTSAHTISATFVKKTYAITASAGTGGSISPSGSTSIQHGGSQKYTITPSAGYEIADVKVDGKSVGKVSSYTFSNVTGTHSIAVSFRLKPIADLGSITVTDTLGAALNGKATKSGYGICVSVPVTLENVTDVTVTLSYNFGAGKKTVTLTEVGGKYVLPVNPDSVSNARCVYIPVETPDGSYTLTASVSARDADGNTVTDSATAVVTVLGSMYEDDFTADS